MTRQGVSASDYDRKDIIAAITVAMTEAGRCVAETERVLNAMPASQLDYVYEYWCMPPLYY